MIICVNRCASVDTEREEVFVHRLHRFTQMKMHFFPCGNKTPQGKMSGLWPTSEEAAGSPPEADTFSLGAYYQGKKKISYLWQSVSIGVHRWTKVLASDPLSPQHIRLYPRGYRQLLAIVFGCVDEQWLIPESGSKVKSQQIQRVKRAVVMVMFERSALLQAWIESSADNIFSKSWGQE